MTRNRETSAASGSIRRATRLWLPAVAALFGLLGCSGQGHSGGDTGHKVDPLCAKACDTVRTCDAAADLQACQTQCDKELGGTGYLIPEVAKAYFEQFAAAGDDTKCYYSRGGYAWFKWTKDPGAVDALAEQDLMTTCRKDLRDLLGGASADDYRADCFMSYYRYNQDRRQAIETCLSMSDPAQSDACTIDKQPKGHPWLAGIDQDGGP